MRIDIVSTGRARAPGSRARREAGGGSGLFGDGSGLFVTASVTGAKFCKWLMQLDM